jgi:sRNA-binding protein
LASRNGASLPQCDDTAEVQGKEDRNPLASSRTRERNLEAEAAVALLAECFPKCFVIYERKRRPLKIGINADLQAALNGALKPQELGAALRFYTQNIGYLRAMLCGAWRIDLAGNSAGVVDHGQEAAAKATIATRLVKCAAKAARAKAEAEAKQRALQPKRYGLADLREAARLRKAGAP